jgi:hypothetical protein
MQKRLAVGKVRGLQQIADQKGIFAMCPWITADRCSS